MLLADLRWLVTLPLTLEYHGAQGGEAAVLLADLRCLPGCEGAPVVGADGRLVGLLAAPLAHRGFQAEVSGA